MVLTYCKFKNCRDNEVCLLVMNFFKIGQSFSKTYMKFDELIMHLLFQPSVLDAFRHSAQHHSIVAPQKKSDCETKMDNLHQQILSFGLKFGEKNEQRQILKGYCCI